MSAKKITYLGLKVQQFLEKTATSFPSHETVYPLIVQVIEASKASPFLSGFVEVATPVTVDVDTMDAKCSVYFQLVFEADEYTRIMNEPDLKVSLVQLIQPTVQQSLQQKFRAYEFRVKLGVVPEIG